MRILGAVMLVVVLALPVHGFAQAVRCVDANGHVYYGAQAPQGVTCVSESAVPMPKQPDQPKTKPPRDAVRTGSPDRHVLWLLSQGRRPTISKVYDSEAQCQVGRREAYDEWRGASEIVRSGLGATCLPVGVNP